ncbi:MAG TPA: hypothetical protein VFO55_05640 [Gemmatimonadaceae bacterium]|nr:hypothetical protein [Gemmatimonadaceae bacterium]
MTTFSPLRRPGRIAAALALALSLGACKELTSIDASFQNVTIADTVYSLNGSPPAAHNAIKLFDLATRRADQGFSYDIAFDIDAAGNAVIIPARAVATNFSSPYSVALLAVPGTFESVLSAPEDVDYRPDTATTIPVGQIMIIESRDNAGMCLYSLKGSSYFSKLVITHVDPVKRTLGFTATINRNCGFRSFEPGIPRD